MKAVSTAPCTYVHRETTCSREYTGYSFEILVEPDSPSATTNFTATTITLFITPPANPNGVVINYRIELTDENSVSRIINTGSADTVFNITNLSPFTEYNISLQAENGAIASLRFSDLFELTLRTAEARRLTI